jgi:hypothetical protein
MAEVQIQNILVGYGDLYYTDLRTYDAQGRATGTVTPDPRTGLEAALVAEVGGARAYFDDALNNWDYAGATQEGVEIAYAPEYGEVQVDQLGDAALMFFESASVTLNTTLAEATLLNLAFAWGYGENFLESLTGNNEKFSIGIPGTDPVERAIAVLGKAPADATGAFRDRVYVGNRALSVEGSSLALRRSENTAYAVSIRLLAEPAAAFKGEEYGIILDIVPATGP